MKVQVQKEKRLTGNYIYNVIVDDIERGFYSDEATAIRVAEGILSGKEATKEIVWEKHKMDYEPIRKWAF